VSVVPKARKWLQFGIYLRNDYNSGYIFEIITIRDISWNDYKLGYIFSGYILKWLQFGIYLWNDYKIRDISSKWLQFGIYLRNDYNSGYILKWLQIGIYLEMFTIRDISWNDYNSGYIFEMITIRDISSKWLQFEKYLRNDYNSGYILEMITIRDISSKIEKKLYYQNKSPFTI